MARLATLGFQTSKWHIFHFVKMGGRGPTKGIIFRSIAHGLDGWYCPSWLSIRRARRCPFHRLGLQIACPWP